VLGLFINLIKDKSVDSAPAGFVEAVTAAAQVYDQAFPGNDYTVNIRYGWGTLNNAVYAPLTNGTYSVGGPASYDYNINYATLLFAEIQEKSLTKRKSWQLARRMPCSAARRRIGEACPSEARRAWINFGMRCAHWSG
jgi:hypothetical protein